MWVRKVLLRIQGVLHPKTVEVNEEEEDSVDDDEMEDPVDDELEDPVDNSELEASAVHKLEGSDGLAEPSNIGSCDSMTWLEWFTMLIWRLFGFSGVCWNGSHWDCIVVSYFLLFRNKRTSYENGTHNRTGKTTDHSARRSIHS